MHGSKFPADQFPFGYSNLINNTFYESKQFQAESTFLMRLGSQKPIYLLFCKSDDLFVET